MKGRKNLVESFRAESMSLRRVPLSVKEKTPIKVFFALLLSAKIDLHHAVIFFKNHDFPIIIHSFLLKSWNVLFFIFF
jgi:hypothetical protein